MVKRRDHRAGEWRPSVAATRVPVWTTGPSKKIKRESFFNGNKCIIDIVQ